MIHKARLDKTHTVVRCSVMHEKPICLITFAKRSDIPSTLYNSSVVIERSSSNQAQIVTKKISVAVLAIGTIKDMKGGSVAANHCCEPGPMISVDQRTHIPHLLISG
jgi:hypothetical protein